MKLRAMHWSRLPAVSRRGAVSKPGVVSKLGAALLAAALSGCALVGPPPALRQPNPSWSEAPQGPGLQRKELARWWEGFHDPELTRLVAQALDDSLDLKIALARVREARAAATVAGSTLWPTLNFDTFAGRNKDLERLPVKPPIANVATAGFSAQWEIDLLGGNAAGAAAAESRATAQEELSDATRVLLTSEIAVTLFEQRGAVERLTILRRNVDVAEEGLHLAEARFARGLATALDVDRATTQLRTLQGELPLLEGEIVRLTQRLAVLRGRTPQSEPPSAVPVPENLPGLPAVLPSQWLDARPDLKAARHDVEAANFVLAAARSDLFPKFTLLASAHRERIALLDRPALTDSVFSLGAGLVEPIFNAGRIRAQIDGADARLGVAAASYDRALLTAIEEVENAFVAFDAAERQQTELRLARAAADSAEKRASALYQRGLVDYGAYLDTQRTALQVEDGLTRATTGKAVALVSLYRAFGGGLDEHSDAQAPAVGTAHSELAITARPSLTVSSNPSEGCETCPAQLVK